MATFTITLDNNFQLTKDIAQAINLPQILKEEMLNTRARIISDLVAGKDADGGSLKPYSRFYVEAIDSGHVFGKAPGNHTPNLLATGQLHRSMHIEGNGLEVRMFFQGTHAKPRSVSEKHAKKKRDAAAKGGHEIQHRGNRPVGATGGSGSRGAKSQGGGGRRTGGGGGDVPNATIAKAQYDMGRDGWFQFADKDIFRLQARIEQALASFFTGLKFLR